MGQHRRLLPALALVAALLTGCAPAGAGAPTVEEIHMYGDAVDAYSFAKISNAHITVAFANQRETFTGSYDIVAPVHERLTITATAPGYQDYRAQTALNPQTLDELRSPLLLRPTAQ